MKPVFFAHETVMTDRVWRLVAQSHQSIARAAVGHLAHEIAVRRALRQLNPYHYQPAQPRIAHSEVELMRDLQACILESSYVNALIIGEMGYSNPDEWITGLASSGDAKGIAEMMQLTSLALACRPSNSAYRITRAAIMIRFRQYSAAKEQLLLAERLATVPEQKSRALANRAVIAELYGDVEAARALTQEAVATSIVSPIALHNWAVYHSNHHD